VKLILCRKAIVGNEIACRPQSHPHPGFSHSGPRDSPVVEVQKTIAKDGLQPVAGIHQEDFLKVHVGTVGRVAGTIGCGDRPGRLAGKGDDRGGFLVAGGKLTKGRARGSGSPGSLRKTRRPGSPSSRADVDADGLGRGRNQQPKPKRKPERMPSLMPLPPNRTVFSGWMSTPRRG